MLRAALVALVLASGCTHDCPDELEEAISERRACLGAYECAFITVSCTSKASSTCAREIYVRTDAVEYLNALANRSGGNDDNPGKKCSLAPPPAACINHLCSHP